MEINHITSNKKDNAFDFQIHVSAAVSNRFELGLVNTCIQDLYNRC